VQHWEGRRLRFPVLLFVAAVAPEWALHAAETAPTTPPEPQSVESEWVLDAGLCEPETVVFDRAREQLLVSNICGFERNGRGYLSRVSLGGQMLEERWVEGLDSPAGMSLLGRRLYVADYDRVRVIDVDSGELEESLPFDAGALNDIAVSSEGTIYVSDSVRHRVLRRDEGETVALAVKFTNANGLYLTAEHLYVGGEFLWKVELASDEVERIGPSTLGDIDGIEGDGAGGLVVSVVGGPIWHLGGGKVAVWTAPGVSSTNHLYLEELRLVVVPTGFDGTLVAFELPADL